MIDSFLEELGRLGATAVLGVVLDQYSSPEAATLNREQSDALVELCLNNRVGAILLEAVTQGRVILAEPAVLWLREGVAFLLSTQLKVERGALAMIDLLSADGIEFRVLKGMATAYLDYPNPAFRSFGDVDLLVRPRDVPRMMRMLEMSGRGHFYVIRGNDWRIQHAVTFVMDGIEVDLHHRLLHQAAGHRVSKLDLFADPDWYEIAGRRVAGLPPWLRLLQVVAQSAPSSPEDRRLVSGLDECLLDEHRGSYEKVARSIGLHLNSRAGLRDGASAVARARAELAVASPAVGLALVRSVLFPGGAYLQRRRRRYGQHLRRQVLRLIGRTGSGG